MAYYFMLEDLCNNKVDVRAQIYRFFTQTLPAAGFLNDGQVSYISSHVTSKDDQVIKDYAYLFELAIAHRFCKTIPSSFVDLQNALKSISQAVHTNVSLDNAYNYVYGNFTHEHTLYEIFASDPTILKTVMSDDRGKESWSVINQAYGAILIGEGLSDVTKIVFWLIISGIIAGIGAWLESLNLPSWAMAIITPLINWAETGAQQQAQTAENDLTGVVNELTAGNQVLNQIANNLLQVAASFAQSLQANLSAAVAQKLEDLTTQLSESQNNSTNNLTLAQVNMSNHIDQMSRQLSYQLAVNQQSMIEYLNNNSHRVIAYV